MISLGSEAQLDIAISRYFAVALGLLFLGQSERSEATIEALGMISHPIAKYAHMTILSLSYCSTGNVLKVQELLGQCVEHIKDPKQSEYQQVALLGIALVGSSEDIGNEMAHRLLNHVLQFCDISVKRAVPLALALLNVPSHFSHPPSSCRVPRSAPWTSCSNSPTTPTPSCPTEPSSVSAFWAQEPTTRGSPIC